MKRLLFPSFTILILVLGNIPVQSQGSQEISLGALTFDTNNITHEQQWTVAVINKVNKSFIDVKVTFVFNNKTYINRTIPMLGPYESKNVSANWTPSDIKNTCTRTISASLETGVSASATITVLDCNWHRNRDWFFYYLLILMFAISIISYGILKIILIRTGKLKRNKKM
jgi:hypothetical protein